VAHKDKISSPKKTIYVLTSIAAICVALSVLSSLLIQKKINNFYEHVYSRVLNNDTHIANARFLVQTYLEEPSATKLTAAWYELDQADINSSNVIKEVSNFKIILLPLNDAPFISQVQKLQTLQPEFYDLSRKIIKAGKIIKDDKLKIKWENTYNKIKRKNGDVRYELIKLINNQTQMFGYVQFGFISAAIILIAVMMFVFISSEKKQAAYLRRIEETSKNLEVGIRKTTRTEEALNESQRKLNTLINNLPGMVYRFKSSSIWSMDFVSDKSISVTGYKAEDLINDKAVSYYNIIHPNDQKKIFDQVQKAIEERKPYQLVYRITTAQGYERWVWEQGVGIFNEAEDDLIALEGFIFDITEQKAVEDQLNVQSNALEAAANGIVIMDNEGNVLWCNSAFTNLTGYTLKEIMGGKLDILKSKNYPSEIYDVMWNTVISGDSWHGELVNRRKDGRDYFEETTVTPVKNADGGLNYIISIKQDITARKESEQALIESEIRFRGLYENATIGIYRTSPSGEILMANTALVKLYGVESFQEFSKMSAEAVYVDPKVRDQFIKELTNVGFIRGFETKWRKKDGTIIYVRESARAVKNDKGSLIYFEGTVEDISEKKRAEEEIILAKEKAEKSDRLKSDFLAQMSHEIRTPLNVILNFTSILKEELQESVDEDLKSSFDVIDIEGKRIMRTVELILNMSEIQTGNYNFMGKQLDLMDVIAKLVSDFEPIAHQKKLDFLIVNNTKKLYVIADEYSLIQIFYHILDNAIKYTSKGKVEVLINRDINNKIVVDIVDTGIGISEDYMSMLFTPFTREEQGYTRNFEGNGLGLALVKKYCDLNGTDIRVMSQKGKGSTFRLTFSQLN
jgi:PAS domain S-box-containing protein